MNEKPPVDPNGAAEVVGAENAKPLVDVGADDAGATNPKPLLGVVEVDEAGAENAKPLVEVDDGFDDAPNVNNDDDDVDGAPNAENDGIDVAGLSAVVEGAAPNVLAAPNAGVDVVEALVETTEGANGFGGLLAPNVNGVLFEAVVVVAADGKLKPDEDVDADVVAIGRDVEVDEVGMVLENEKPPVAVVVAAATAVGKDNDEVVVLDAVVVDEKANRFGVVDAVVAAEIVVDGAGAREEVDEFAPKANKVGFSDDVVVVDVDADNGVLPNEPNVGVVDAVVVVVAVKDKEVLDVVVGNVPKAGNVEGVLVPDGKRLIGVLVTGLSEVVAPNNGAVVAVVEPNETVTFSLLVLVDIVPNVGKETGAENDAAVVTDSTETFATTIVDGEVKLVGALDTTDSSTIVSFVFVIEDEEIGVGSIALNRL